MKNIITLFFGLISIALCYDSMGQGGVGVGTTTVVDDAALQVESPSKNQGLLIPSMSTTERTNGWATTSGVMVYDTDVKAFFYYDGASWIRLIASPAKLEVNMNAHKITNLANATNAGDAVNKGQLDAAITGVDNKNLDIDGTQAMTGDLDMGGKKVTNMGDGTSDGDAVNRGQLNAVRDRMVRTDWFTWPPDERTTYPPVAHTSTLTRGHGNTFIIQFDGIINFTNRRKTYLCVAFFSLTGSGEPEDIGISLKKDGAIFASWRRWIRSGWGNSESLYTIIGKITLDPLESASIINEIKLFDDDIFFEARGMFCISSN